MKPQKEEVEQERLVGEVRKSVGRRRSGRACVVCWLSWVVRLDLGRNREKTTFERASLVPTCWSSIVEEEEGGRPLYELVSGVGEKGSMNTCAPPLVE